ncbi:MAG: amidohydrolase family protein [Proteobacteria bacterium]|nr:amidohydrolase family protein [Pseudomonadota bacterium]MBI3499812.1 amidohydrolase family protein [Pseudomonadota bacterium]
MPSQPAPDFVLANALMPDGRRGAIGIAQGRIVEIAATPRPGVPGIDLAGDLVMPGFVDGHMHLDKTLVGLGWMPHQAKPDRMSRIETDKRIWPTLNLSVAARAANLIELCIAHGTTQIRTHVDVDTEGKLSQLHGVLEARERYRDRVSIEIVAFPQSGVMRRPGTLDLLDAAVADGADLVGGIDPLEIDRDPAGQLSGIFAIAERRGIGLDIHLHEPGELGLFNVHEICRRTEASGLGGKVTISHGFCLGMVADAKADDAASRMARAGVSLVTHGGASAAIPPLLKLRAAGVEVFAGNDDVRDTWSPYGSGDMLERAMLIGWRSDFRRDDQLALAFDLVSAAGARALGLGPHGIAVGAPADLSVAAASGVPEAVVAHPPRKWVMKRGRIVARGGSTLARPEAPVGLA